MALSPKPVALHRVAPERTRIRSGRSAPLGRDPGPAPAADAAPRLVGLPFERDSYAATALADVVDRSVHATTAQWTAGLSPAALWLAFMDWALHLASAPGKRMQLAQKGLKKGSRLAAYAWTCALQGSASSQRCIEPLAQDRRFVDEAWMQWPFNVLHQSFLLQQQWWHNAMTGVRGVSARHENLVQFVVRQALDTVSPSNFLLTNPEALQRTLQESGANLWRGAIHALEDWQQWMRPDPGRALHDFEPGRNVATTPGRVVLRNRLIELIQYDSTTGSVAPEPVLIVPAWIMKYYVLDLSPRNSLVRHLVGSGYTVFMISWKNPQPEDRELALEDYCQLGVMAALQAVQAIAPRQRVHAVGYCLGGTLLAMVAAAMARDDDERLATISLFAAQMDFSEAGELTLFISESQLSFLEDMMWEQGFLDSSQMAGAFQTLRSGDLVWSRLVRERLLGDRSAMTDLTAWNADATRMPFKMHSQYLRELFLNNDLAEGRMQVGGRPVSLTAIRTPAFAVATENDHIAPWRSVFKIHSLLRVPVHFILSSGGHNTGIVSEPGHAGRHFRSLAQPAWGRVLQPEDWRREASWAEGSWWPAWTKWLKTHSGRSVRPPSLGNAEAGFPALEPAPGHYVLQR